MREMWCSKCGSTEHKDGACLKSEPPILVQRLVGPISHEHPEAKCEDCGGANVVWHAPSQIWNKVCRPPGYRCDPMLCPTCFIIRAEKVGIHSTSWRVCPEDWPNNQDGRSVRPATG